MRRLAVVAALTPGAYLAAIGTGAGIRADFGSGTWEGGPIGIPYTVVPASQPKVPVRFAYAGESDPGPYPVPPAAAAARGPAGLLPQLLAGVLGLVAAALAMAQLARSRRRPPPGRHARSGTPAGRDRSQDPDPAASRRR